MRELKTVPGRALTDYLYAKAIKRNIPLSGTFELTPLCNFSCRMCYVRKTAKEVRAHDRPMLTLEDWLRIAREARDAGLLYLLITGGEPLLWPDFWTLYDALIDMGFLISINTNGSLIGEEAIAHFRRKPPLKLNITLYGASDETYRRLCGADGVFSKVDRAITGLLNAGIPVKINCSLTPQNAEDLDWIVDYAKEKQTHISIATYMFPPVRRDPSQIGVNERFTPEESARHLLAYYRRLKGEEFYRRYLQSLLDGCVEPPGLDESCIDPVDGKIRCRAGRASFWITWDGWLLPCGMMPQPRTELRDVAFSDAWSTLVRQASQLKLSGVCDKCPNLQICHPCAAISYAETGSCAGIPTYLCRSTLQQQRIARETLNPDEG